MKIFNYHISVRNPVEYLGQLDAFYPSFTIVLRWPVVISRLFDEDDFPF